jgi:hypothetical protein
MEIANSRDIEFDRGVRMALIMFDTGQTMMTVHGPGSTFSLHLPLEDLEKVGATIQALAIEHEAVNR